MSAPNLARKGRALAKTFYPVSEKVTPQPRHGRDAKADFAGAAASGRLRYHATPFYLKIPGLEGPRPSRFIERN